MSRQKYGFTILELLIVIVVILILGTITAMGIANYKHRIRIDASKGLIERLANSLERYKEKFRAYPPSDGDWDGSQNLYYYLGVKIEYIADKNIKTGEGRFEFYGPLEHFKKQELNGEKYIIDSWGNEIYYINPGEDHSPDGLNNKTLFDLASWGPDEEQDDPGEEEDQRDDITNWNLD